MLAKIWPHLNYFFKDFYPYLILSALSFTASLILIFKIYKSKTTLFKKRLFISSVFTILTLIFVFTFFEAYFRYRYDVSDGLGFLKVNERWHKRHVVYNGYFFRDKDFDPNKKEDIIRIGVLGDSIVFGGGIKNVNDRFSNLLEKKLKDSGKNVEVYNLGTPGYDTDGEIMQYEKVKNLNFDIIVWEYFLNDIQKMGESTGTPIIVNNSKKSEAVSFLTDKSFFSDFLYWRFSSRYNKILIQLRTADLDRYKDTGQVEVHKKQIASFLADLEKENKKVVVVIFPLLTFLGPNYPADNIHQMMSEVFKDNGAEVVDLLDYLKGQNGRDFWASEFDSHPNESVHKLAADKLYEKILPLLK